MQHAPEEEGLGEVNKSEAAADESSTSVTTTTTRPALGIGQVDLAKALRSRVPAIRNGELLTILFMRTKVPRKPRSIYLGNIGAAARASMRGARRNAEGDAAEVEISGHIDIDARMKTENIMPYLNGEKRLVPRKGDLTYYNWDRGTAYFSSTPNFDVVAKLPSLRLRHVNSDAKLDITTSAPGRSTKYLVIS